jgi:hypothetical protein
MLALMFGDAAEPPLVHAALRALRALLAALHAAREAESAAVATRPVGGGSFGSDDGGGGSGAPMELGEDGSGARRGPGSRAQQGVLVSDVELQQLLQDVAARVVLHPDVECRCVAVENCGVVCCKLYTRECRY